MIKKLLFSALLVLSGTCGAVAQKLVCDNEDMNKAFALAVWTVDNNTHNKLLHAGARYGGEWTRDISINSWNAVSLLRPDVAEYSMWSVTADRDTIGHQYWDKIIWVVAAYNHYLVNGSEEYLKAAYRCSKNTMEQLEKEQFDKKYGMFMGPAVFQDGIAAYDEPVFDPANPSSYVLDHNASKIKCLSTNATYYEAYVLLAKMAEKLDKAAVKGYEKKAKALRAAIRKNLFDAKNGKLNYLVDQNGKVHEYQEALGLAYAIEFGVVTREEALKILANAKVSRYGIVTVYPCFPRNTIDKPGRHNMMVWPHVNMAYASACSLVGDMRQFYFEVDNLTYLAIVKGQNSFYEIYRCTDGIPSGGWQCDHVWPPLEHQSWCATGYLHSIINHIFGMTYSAEGITFVPKGMKDGSKAVLSDIKYRDAVLNITITGRSGNGEVKSFTVNGEKKSKPFLPADAKGECNIVIEL